MTGGKLCYTLVCMCLGAGIALAKSTNLGSAVDDDSTYHSSPADDISESREDNTTALTEVMLDDYRLDSGTRLYYMNELCGKKIQINNRDAVRVAPWSTKYPPSNFRCFLVVESSRYQSYRMVVTFRSMEMSAGGATGYCRTSRLDLYDGTTTGRLISGTNGICGSRAPRQQYTTDKNAVSMKYSTGTIRQHEREYFDAVITPFHYGHCDRNEFRCANRRCVKDNLLCDGYNNCGDASDETHCQALALSITAIVLIAVGCVIFIGIIVTIIICKCCCAICGYERL